MGTACLGRILPPSPLITGADSVMDVYRADWRPATASLRALQKLQPAGNRYEDTVSEAADVGINESPRIFSLGSVHTDSVSNWVLFDDEYADIVGRLTPLERASSSEDRPPPTIVVRYLDRSVWGRDGYHRYNSARRVGLNEIPCLGRSREAGMMIGKHAPTEPGGRRWPLVF